MVIKDVLVHHTPGHGAASQPHDLAAYAISMAETLGAHLTSLVFAFDFTRPAVFYGGATNEDIEEARDRFRRAAEDATLTFVSSAKRAGISYETATEEWFADAVPDVINDYAKLYDLMICSNDQTGLLSRKGIAEHVLFASGRPVVVVPPGYGRPFACDRLMVAWDYSRPAARAAADAMPLLKRAKQVFVVTVSGDKQLKSGRSGAELARHFSRHGVEVIIEAIPRTEGSIDQTLLAHATARQADLIVMGGYGHSRLREFILGGATHGMLENTDRPVLLSH